MRRDGTVTIEISSDNDLSGSVYGSYSTNTVFDTEANFDLYDPYQILASNLTAVNDKKRIVIAGYETFQAAQEDMEALLTANGVLFDSISSDTGDHSWSAMADLNFVEATLALAGIT